MYLFRSYTDLELMESLSDVPSSDTLLTYDASTLLRFVDQHLAGWIVYRCARYAPEYDVLTRNWYQLCNQWQTTPQDILIVEFLPHDDWTAYTFLQGLCNALTKCGYVVRNRTELGVCEQCGDALLSEAVLTHVQNRYPGRFAHSWSPRCVACRDR